MKTLEILLEASVMYNRHAAASLNEEDSTGDNILWKESYDERQFLYPRWLLIIGYAIDSGFQ